MKTKTYIISILVVMCLLFALSYLFNSGRIIKNIPVAVGGANIGNECLATTTSAWLTHPTSVGWKLVEGRGALCSIIVGKAGTAGGTIDFYNATTSNATKRTTISTTTALLISIPTDLAAGDYEYNTHFTNGLFIDVIGTISSTTITYRQY